ncbi:flavodoxin family protein [Thermodesulforhabdus norvegica]|uniref:Multimeric flavodoxin WrbA n=1 Tax=Thermodesulforhabdus norvegica TaxID=39841 RepID=A0A1I4S3A2_9BACT|nr:flavodoxin family protein [Thermodesulforhabdus norvegica]SFM58733.1 Multimeric flavodoxin WrbA [Thermodesulforhabdus norvegica]
MKILGISGSPRKEEQSGVYQTVKAVLDATGLDYELISLRGKKIGGCIACLKCAEDNVCKVKDDMEELREKIVEADAYVIGAPNYYSGINALTRAFLERWFQFRHREGNLLWGKRAVAVGIGGTSGVPPAEEIEMYMMYNFIKPVARVTGQGAASCYSCGFGHECKVGIPYMLYGDEAKNKVLQELAPDVRKDRELMNSARRAGELLARDLAECSREEVTREMQKLLFEKMKESV